MVRIKYLKRQMKVLFISHDIEKRGDLKRNSSEAALVGALRQAHELRVVALPPGTRASPGAAGHAAWEVARQALNDIGQIWVPDAVLEHPSIAAQSIAPWLGQILAIPSMLVLDDVDDGGMGAPLGHDCSLARSVPAADAVVRLNPVPGDSLRSNEPPTASADRWSREVAMLEDVLRPLVLTSQNPDRPWWAGRASATSAVNLTGFPPAARPSAFRQLVRRGMNLLPRRLFLTHGPRGGRNVCLTFDDGPHPEHTPRLLDELARLRIAAVFFIVGRQAQQYPQIVRRIAAEGHVVANHTFYHCDLRLLPNRAALQEAEDSDRVLLRLLGKSARLYRPPRGKISLPQLMHLWRAAYTLVLWSVDSKDYECQSFEDLETWVRSQTFRPGDIVLMHDRLPFAAQALPALADTVRSNGMDFATLDAWVNVDRDGNLLSRRAQEQ